MWRTKVPAFSLVEMLVVMVLSSLVVSAIYFAYYTINTYQVSLTRKYESLGEAAALNDRLKADLERADIVLRMDSGIVCNGAARTVGYQLYPEFIVRRQATVLDTFHCKVTGRSWLFNGAAQTDPQGPVDEIIVEGITLSKPVRYHVIKEYDAYTLVKYIKHDSLP